MTSLLLFVLIVVAGIILIVEIIPDASFRDLQRENTYIANTLMEPGFPLNWTNETVLIPGIAKDHRINKTKLFAFSNLSYNQQKTTLQVSGEFLFFFRNATDIYNLTQCNYGYPAPVNASCHINLTGIEKRHVITTTRLVIYDGEPVLMEVQSWI